MTRANAAGNTELNVRVLREKNTVLHAMVAFPERMHEYRALQASALAPHREPPLKCAHSGEAMVETRE